MLEEFPALDKLHNEVDAVGFLEDVVHPDDERMVHLVEDELFHLEGLDGLVLDHHVLSNALHGVVLVGELVLDEENFAKGASSNYADQLKVVPAHL